MKDVSIKIDNNIQNNKNNTSINDHEYINGIDNNNDANKINENDWTSTKGSRKTFFGLIKQLKGLTWREKNFIIC